MIPLAYHTSGACQLGRPTWKVVLPHLTPKPLLLDSRIAARNGLTTAKVGLVLSISSAWRVRYTKGGLPDTSIWSITSIVRPLLRIKSILWIVRRLISSCQDAGADT